MEILDGRKKRQAAIKAKNRETIVKWIDKHPGSSISECCNGVNMSYQTVRNHINEIEMKEKYNG